MSDDDAEPPSTREYLRLVFLNRLGLAGIAVAVVGLVALRLAGSRTGATVGTVLALAGVGLFIVGFTLVQRRLARETDWGH
jgi:drug/metabolite transporter (DMT)-like permease